MLGDVAGAILAQPDPKPVPGPIAGAGIPGVALGMSLWAMWRRRKTSVSHIGSKPPRSLCDYRDCPSAVPASWRPSVQP